MKLPNITKAVVLRASANAPSYHDVVIESRPVPPLKAGQLLLKMGAVALNHRDVGARMTIEASNSIRFGYGRASTA